ncbi:hypothetical protein Psuf_021980 [Phytohabitans suffuscus]|uniref:Uncharacterized protein n=1 Tax=Phytohabitans suffuscus TaxID=624315 RepID=A0A6F8YFI3_9ACTN|nr:hypothetical protein Psuf_021980 [Phytohabitans suffuscus]
MSTCTPARQATTCWVGTGPPRSTRPGSFWSNSNKIRARRTCEAGCEPVRTNAVNISRSAGLNATGRDFVLATSTHSRRTERGKKPANHQPTPQTTQISGDTLLVC